MEKIDYGYHSIEFMSTILKDFKYFIKQLFNNKTNWLKESSEGIVLSNLDGKQLKQSLDLAEYLGKQLSEPVRLDFCLKTWEIFISSKK